MKKTIFLLAFIGFFSCKKAEDKTSDTATKSTEVAKVTEVKNDIERIEPPYWWTGFKNTKLQLLVNHPSIAKATPSISDTNINIEKVQQGESPNYLFIDIDIANANTGQFNIEFKLENGKTLTQTYELKARTKAATDYVGFNSSDVLYLITPDRFANGNTSNDIPVKKTGLNEAGQKVSFLKEASINRKDTVY